MINEARIAWLPTRYITAAMSPFLRRIEPLGRASEVNISYDNMRCGLLWPFAPARRRGGSTAQFKKLKRSEEKKRKEAAVLISSLSS